MESKKVTILVVDDDPTIRQLCADVLTDEGFNVDTASNGQEALARIESNGIKVALIDIMMPIMDGVQLSRIIRSRADMNHLGIIMMSAASNLMNNVTRELADRVLVKPFEIDRLISCVEQLAAS